MLDADRPLVVDVAELRRHPATQEPIVLEVAIEGLSTSGGSVPGGRSVSVDLVLESMPEGIVATGTVGAPWEAQCRRCLTGVTGRVEARVREVFADEPDEDAEILPIVEDHIDLRAPVRDAVVLALPLAPVCAEACKGLCAVCGTDLNVEQCDCVIDTTDPRWDKLSEITFDDEPGTGSAG